MNSHLLVLRVREVHSRGHGHWACSGVLWPCGTQHVTPAEERCLGLIRISSYVYAWHAGLRMNGFKEFNWIS